MRYGLISTVAAAALSLGAAGALAQQSGGTGTSGGSSTGGTSGPQMRAPQTGTGATGTQPGTTQSGGSAQTQQGTGTSGTAQGTTGTTGTAQQPSATGSTSTTGSINLSSEQRTQVTRVFSSVRAEPVDVNFNVTVGAVVPTTVTTLQTCPSEVIRLVNGLPECRYIVVRDKIVLIEPSSRRVVLVLDRQS